MTQPGLLEELALEQHAADELERQARTLWAAAGPYQQYARRAAIDLNRQAQDARAHADALQNLRLDT
jgi:hypothetical protein